MENLCDRLDMDFNNPVMVQYAENLYITESEGNFHKGLTDSVMALSALRKLEYLDEEDYIELRTKLINISTDFKKIMNKAGDTIV